MDSVAHRRLWSRAGACRATQTACNWGGRIDACLSIWSISTARRRKAVAAAANESRLPNCAATEFASLSKTLSMTLTHCGMDAQRESRAKTTNSNTTRSAVRRSGPFAKRLQMGRSRRASAKSPQCVRASHPSCTVAMRRHAVRGVLPRVLPALISIQSGLLSVRRRRRLSISRLLLAS